MSADRDPEAALERLPDGDAVVAAAREAFESRRRKIDARHRQWRANMPSLAPLFDGDEHEAKALAGNLATHAGDLMGAWVACEIELAAPGAARRAALLLEIDRFAGCWRRAAMRFSGPQEWSEDAGEVFDAVLRDLLARASARATEQLADSEPGRGGSGRPLGVAGRWIGALLRRVFRPDGS